jgi:hypothetical protein
MTVASAPGQRQLSSGVALEQYVAPELTRLGSMSELTQGAPGKGGPGLDPGVGSFLD